MGEKKESTDKDGEYVLYTDHIAETRKLIDTYDLLISQEDKKIAELEAENKRLREALDLVISFIPDGWGMPLGFNQVAQQAREALRKTNHELTGPEVVDREDGGQRQLVGRERGGAMTTLTIPGSIRSKKNSAESDNAALRKELDEARGGLAKSGCNILAFNAPDVED